MPYYRRPYKRARYGKKLKYSVQQKAVEFSTGSDDATAKVEVVPASEIEGMRKVKHLTVSCSAEVDTGSFYWALVYVPQGTTPGNITVNIVTGTGGMYEPNQFVMNCGVVDPSAGPIRFSSPVARNLNDGDSIYLLVRNTNNTTAVTYNAVVRYAITLSDHHITPQIYISYEICGARRCSIPFTPSGRVILHPPFLSEFRLIKNRSKK